MAEVHKIIDSLLVARGISGYKMCRDLGMSRSFMTELRKGRAKSLQAETAQKIAEYFNVSVDYILGRTDNPNEFVLNAENFPDIIQAFVNGKEPQLIFPADKSNGIATTEKQKSPDEKSELLLNSIPYVKGRRIPILGSIPAGVPMLAEENIEGYDFADVPEGVDYFFLRVKGDSMINAHIFDGDLVLVRAQSFADNGAIVVCLVNGDEATLKRYRQGKSADLLIPENPAYQPIIVQHKEFDTGYARILGVATEVKHKL